MAYEIEGNSFYDYNLHVFSSMGALDFSRRLGDIDHDWKDSNGVEAYVDAADLLWDGREIKLLAFYKGADFISDLDTFRGLYEGVEAALVTTYGSHTATLKDIKVQREYVTNREVTLVLKFWEPVVTIAAPPAAGGGTGPTIAGYSFWGDFGLRVQRVSGLHDVQYRAMNRTYGNTPVGYSDNRKNRIINIHLNGKYTSLSSLITSINNLHGVMRAAGLKVFAYQGDNYNTYFADLSTVTVDPRSNWASVRLKLRFEE